jgi:hypothetical protein
MDKGNLVCLTSLAISGIIIFFIIQVHISKIKEELKNNNVTDIFVTLWLFDFDKRNFAYKVRYKDMHGNWWKSKICKIHIFGGSIYWKEDDFPW